MFKAVAEPRFLEDLVVPRDVMTIVDKLDIPAGHDQAVYRFILAASVFNGVLVGLPGTLGWGVLAAQAIEVLMAVHIARMVGLAKINLESPPSEVAKTIATTVGAAGITAFSVLYGFKFTLNAVWNVTTNFTPMGWATTVSAILTTLFYGLFLYLAFLELKKLGEDKKLSSSSIKQISQNSYKYTKQIGRSLFKLLLKDSPKGLRQLRDNVRDTFNGVANIRGQIRGEIFLLGCMTYLLEGKKEALDGPFGQIWLEAWRKSFPSQLSDTASFTEISDLANSYDRDELVLIKQNVRSKFYEVLETTSENADGDKWSASLVGTQNQPTVDVLFFDEETGKSFQANYKFTQNEAYIEYHLQKHSDTPVITTPEVAEKMNDPMVLGGKFEHAEISGMSEQHFEEMLDNAPTVDLHSSAAITGATSLGVYILPFFIAYKNKRISREQVEQALRKVVPGITARTINRIAILALLGPVYGMFLIAGLALNATLYGFDEIETPEPPESPPKRPTLEERMDKKFSRRSLITLNFVEEF